MTKSLQKATVFFLGGLVVASAACAQSVTLFGNMGCRDFLGLDAGGRTAYKYWISGYVSASNSFYLGMAPPEMARQLDFLFGRNLQEIEEMVENHCKVNPPLTLQESVVAVIGRLQSEKVGNRNG